MDLQELITRGRFIFSGAAERLRVFELVDGKSDAKTLSRRMHRHINNVRRDLRKMLDAGLIVEKTDSRGNVIRKNGLPVYEQIALARTIPVRYFTAETSLPGAGRLSRSAKDSSARNKHRRPAPISTPTETEVLDWCRSGEDQLIEFKAADTDVRKVTREVCAMLNTKQGGVILYGIDDDGTVQGTSVSRQSFDQSLQNSIKNSISPAATVQVKTINVMGNNVLAVIVPPWDRRNVYQFDEKVLIRKGTNVFGVKPEEMRKLHNHIPIL